MALMLGREPKLSRNSTVMTPKEAKALVAGPYGEEMSKFALRFCQPLFFGLPPSPAHPIKVRNGTMSLLKVGERFFGLTCDHVIKEYRNKRKADVRCILTVANLEMDDPRSKLIAEDRVIDYAVFELTAAQAKEVIKDSKGIGEAFFEVNPHAPTSIKVGDFVAFAGFPEELRKLTSFDRLNFGTYSSGACRVTDTHGDYFICEFEREYWLRHFPEPDPECLSGLSGGPVFAVRFSPSGIQHYEFVGYIWQIYPETELLMVRHVSAIWAVLSGEQDIEQ